MATVTGALISRPPIKFSAPSHRPAQVSGMVFGSEAITEMDEILDAAFEKLQGTGEPDVVRERIATKIIAAARLG
jgi:hypothetical protein